MGLLRVTLVSILLIGLISYGTLADNLALTSTEEEYEDANQSNSLSHEDDATIESPEVKEDMPIIACEKGGICTCTSCKKCAVKTAGEVTCEKVTLKKGGLLLATANLRISKERNVDFVAYSVNLKHNDIDILRKGMVLPGREAEVEYLDVSFNRIKDVEPYTFEKFTRLAKLKLSHNRLRYNEISTDWLTPNLGRSLHQLHLDWNQIAELEEGVFDHLGNLTKLVLDGNKGLKLTRRTFGSNLLKLKTLSLDKCDLEDLNEDVFKNLPALTDLSLSGNRFHSIPLSALQGIPLLSILAMSETNLEKVPSLAFDKLSNLKGLYLRQMPSLTEVEDCAFCRLNMLETLDLSKSPKLSTINVNALAGYSNTEVAVSTLQSLQLINCNLSVLSVDLVDWSGVKRLGLGGNPWSCDCPMKWFIVGNKQQKLFHKLVGTDQPTCASPEPLKGITLAEAADIGDFTCEGFKSSSKKETEGSGGKMTLALVLIGLVGSMFIVGVVYARRKGLGQTLYFGGSGGGGGNGSGWPSVNGSGDAGGPPLGYANLPRRDGINHRHGSDDSDDERDLRQPEFV